jgi:glutaredoxin
MWTGLAVSLVLACGPVQGQQVYKIVGPDGRVTFSDRPLSNGTATVAGQSRADDPATSRQNLPFELQQLNEKYPVTLYTTKNCGPCDSGRTTLSKRGIPFTEKTVNTNDDIAAFVRINPDNTLPLLTIGGKQVQGYSDSEWTQYLDAAGYPKQSVLPPRYKTATAVPLTPLKTASEVSSQEGSARTTGDDATDGTRRRTAQTPPKIINRGTNPAGIQF